MRSAQSLFEIVDLVVIEAVVVADLVPEGVANLLFQRSQTAGVALQWAFEERDFVW